MSGNILALLIYLVPGTYTFKFVIDQSVWKYDPEIAFSTDEYGNINNVIEVYSGGDPKQIQRPTKTILHWRDSYGLKQVNPAASSAVARYHKLLRCSSVNDANEYNLDIPKDIKKPLSSLGRLHSLGGISLNMLVK